MKHLFFMSILCLFVFSCDSGDDEGGNNGGDNTLNLVGSWLTEGLCMGDYCEQCIAPSDSYDDLSCWSGGWDYPFTEEEVIIIHNNNYAQICYDGDCYDYDYFNLDGNILNMTIGYQDTILTGEVITYTDNENLIQWVFQSYPMIDPEGNLISENLLVINLSKQN